MLNAALGFIQHLLDCSDNTGFACPGPETQKLGAWIVDGFLEEDLAYYEKQELKLLMPSVRYPIGQLTRCSADPTCEIRSADIVIYISVPCDVI